MVFSFSIFKRWLQLAHVALALLVCGSTQGQTKYHEFKIGVATFWGAKIGLHYEYVPSAKWGIHLGVESIGDEISLSTHRLNMESASIIQTPIVFPSMAMHYEAAVNYYLTPKTHHRATLAIGLISIYSHEAWRHPDLGKFCSELTCSHYQRDPEFIVGPRLGFKFRLWRNFYGEFATAATIYRQFGKSNVIRNYEGFDFELVQLALRLTYRIHTKKSIGNAN